jgi:hypothetical protein
MAKAWHTQRQWLADLTYCAEIVAGTLRAHLEARSVPNEPSNYSAKFLNILVGVKGFTLSLRCQFGCA